MKFPRIVSLSNTSKLTVGLIIALILSTLFIMHLNTLTQDIPKNKINSSDGFMKNAALVEYNAQGHIQRNLRSFQLTHYPNNTLYFSHPNFLIYGNDNLPWYISSKLGSWQNKIKINLWGDVKIFQPALGKRPATTILMHSVTFYTDTSIAISSELVTVEQANTKIQGVGIIADLKKGNFEILSNAAGTYVPTS